VIAPIDPPPLSPRHWPAWLGIAFGWTLACWPWWLVRRVAPWLGRGMQGLMVSRREVARINLALCFPELDEAARTRLLRAHFRSLGFAVFEFLRAWWGRLPPLDRGLQLEGLAHLQQAQAAGRGVILVSPHFTTLEICNRLLCLSAPIAGMYRPHDSAALDWAVRHGRLGHAAAMFARDELRPAIRHLKAGGLLCITAEAERRRADRVLEPFCRPHD
jgi:KDO2-lipid IV(A) lauroyltransferase